MINKPPLLSTYLFMKKSRIRKKGKIYKQAIGVMIDPVIAIYLVLIGSYAIVSSFFILGDLINDHHDNFIFIEAQATSRSWLILTILPLRYMLQSFSNPGVIFSSSEYQLGMLPFAKEKIWLVSAVEKWLKQTILYLVIGSIVVLVTPISSMLVFTYISLLLTMDIIMTIPQWKLFQVRVLPKLGWIGLILVINVIGILTIAPVAGITMVGIILIINLRLFRTLFQHVHWGQVMEVSDYQIWNMPLIGSVSKVKFKRQKKYSIFQNTAAKKKPLNYTDKAIHHRLWKIYLGKNNELIIRTIGGLFIMLVILPFVNEWAPYLGIVIAIHVYTSVAASFYMDRFRADIISVLPWDLPRYKQSFLKWTMYGGLILLIPICIFLGMTSPIWSLVQLVFFCSIFLYVYQVRINKSMTLLAKESISFAIYEWIGYFMLVFIFFSGMYPAITLSFIFVLLLLKKIKMFHF